MHEMFIAIEVLIYMTIGKGIIDKYLDESLI